MSPSGFWDKFSSDGHHMSYSAIVKHLCQEHVAADQHLAELARREYSEEFTLKFSYCCGSERLVMKTNQKIAERYCELHPNVFD